MLNLRDNYRHLSDKLTLSFPTEILYLQNFSSLFRLIILIREGFNFFLFASNFDCYTFKFGMKFRNGEFCRINILVQQNYLKEDFKNDVY
ncbi:hypothetical protein BpHYR1_032914 [Brachionus plicatilis]|uniref:Uncharacterized protein n=1 Tax=Brachionus plicatilis TaxID=10195 RepID=A0A3M7T4X1_BRAPC|nr:hypothetical protein BpHYR1_032914 [Brachionus plicatilis]